MTSFLYLFVVAILVTGALGSSISPGPLWVDTSGNPIQAHGAGFIRHNGYWYWFGEDKTSNSHLFRNVKAYRSTDLVSWEFVANVLSPDPTNSTEITTQSVVERPKVIYNAKTNKFVLWFHLDSSNYGLAKLGVAYSDKIEGPYTFHKGISPFGEDSRDMTVWVDDDSTGYVIYATRVNLDTVIARLTPDYLDVDVKVHMFLDVRWEAYAMFKTNGLYYLVTSGTSGWDANRNHYTFSRYLNQSWSPAAEIAPDSSNTYNSQSNNVIPVGGNSFIFTADRWFSSSLGDSRYIWLPIEFLDNDAIRISWRPQWWVDTETGQFGNSNSIIYEAENSATSTLNGGATVVSCSGCSDGLAAGYIGFNGTLEVSSVTASKDSTYSVVVSYANGDGGSRQAVITVNGVEQLTVNFPSTGSGNTVKELLFELQLREGVNSIRFSNPNAWAPDLDYIKVQCYYEDCRK